MKLPFAELRKICEEEGIDYMAVFGSVARNEASRDSDIDLLISFKKDKNVGLLRFIGIKHRLEDLLGKKVDLVSKNALNPKIKKYVLAHLKEIYPNAA